ncbi:MAG TPA: ABC transporter ATP-binding protein [Polyangiales bacterium]|jgi:oligopeptide/dipeptide ABC transporter ATP-binding protein|nr:ABC transporter ATP-binding protein [Polyangiales bacterium]
MTEPLLSLRHLVVAFDTDEGYLRAVDDVSFDVAPGKTLGVVGESGCGKSVTSLAMMRLIPSPPGFIEQGEALFEGRDLLRISEPEMRRLRGDEISMIFQEPMTSLNPVYTVGSQIIEAIRLHRNISRRAARAQAIELLDLVGIPAPSERIDSYPHTLSGGMRQRAMIAMALACQPRLLIADEPTTALDVTIQAQILDLLRSLQAELGMSIIFISHDLGVMAEFAHEIVVMYAGRVVERAETHDLFRNPRHPYTRGLLQSLPSLQNRGHRLRTIPGIVPDLRTLPPGCRFRDRCSFAREDCGAEEPPLRRIDRSDVACFYAELIP